MHDHAFATLELRVCMLSMNSSYCSFALLSAQPERWPKRVSSACEVWVSE